MIISLFSLLPRSFAKRYVERARRRLIALEKETRALCQSLEDVEPGFEHTEGYRKHLQRRLDEANLERWDLIEKIVRTETTYLVDPKE